MLMGTIRGARTSRATMAALCAVLALGAAGCGGEDADDAASDAPSETASEPAEQTSPTVGESPTASPSPERTVIPITVRGDSVEPRGERVEVTVGEPFVFVIQSDTDGELHVHATPEAQVAFGPGRTREQLRIDRPGIVEVELHEPTEVTVVQLEVR